MDLTRAPIHRVATAGAVTEGHTAEVSLRVGDQGWRAPVWFCEPWIPAFGLLALTGFVDTAS